MRLLHESVAIGMLKRSVQVASRALSGLSARRGNQSPCLSMEFAGDVLPDAYRAIFSDGQMRFGQGAFG